MAENIAKAGKKSVAVVDFTDLQGNVTELGRFLAEEFSVALASSGKGFELVDRTHLKTIIKEHKLVDTGIIDPTTAKKLGQVAGVDALITGTITPLDNNIRILVKILDTTTAKVIGASKGNIVKTRAIEELLVKGIETVPALSSTTTNTPMTSLPKVLAKAEIRRYSYDFSLEARECKIIGQRINCTIAVINNSPKISDFRLYPRSESLLIDDFGNQYQPIQAGFLKQDRFTDSEDIPPGIPMNFYLQYGNVATTTKYVTVVVQIQGVGKAILRNISLSR
jgi:TolB-like protein